MEILPIHQDDARYPEGVRVALGDHAPMTLTASGNLDLLQCPTLALFCSVRCPGSLIVQTYDLAQRLRQSTITIISGFHSPMERECLAVLLRSSNPLIICPARALHNLRLLSVYKKPLIEGRLLFLSPFSEKQRRATVQTASHRNRFIAALTDRILVPYAEPSSRTEQFCREVLTWRKPLYTIANDANAHIIALGAKPISLDNSFEWL